MICTLNAIRNIIKYRVTLVKNLVDHGEADVDPIEYIILPIEKIIYLVLSKSACTSIKIGLGKNYNIIPHKVSGTDIHVHKMWTEDMRKFGKLGSEYDSHYKFTFVRNPFERIVSCYEDKVLWLNESDPYYFKGKTVFIPPNISFDKFVKIICGIPDYLADRHYKTQYYSIKKHALHYDFIGKVENLKEDWQFISSRQKLTSEILNWNKNERKKDYFQYFTWNSAKLIFRKYKDDVIRFGYLNEYESLLRYLKSNE